MNIMKKSKIFFILTIVFVILSIGTFFYKNSCEEKADALLTDTPENNRAFALDVALRNGTITLAEADAIRSKRDKIYDNEKNSEIIFGISTAITIATLIIGIVFKIKENKEIK